MRTGQVKAGQSLWLLGQIVVKERNVFVSVVQTECIGRKYANRTRSCRESLGKA